MNFSPRIIWSPESAVAVISRVREIVHGSDMVVIAGAPPTWKTQQKSDLTPENFHANIISSVDPNCAVSIDVRGYYLHECLMAKKQPRFVFMNKEEFYEAKESWKQLDRNKSNMTLLVHDKKGCWVWDKNLPDERLLLSRDLFLRSMPVKNVHSTIGAGDAMHAGFLKEWICTENDRNQLRRSIVFSQVVASASVSNIKATHGIDANTVETEFQKVWQGTQR